VADLPRPFGSYVLLKSLGTGGTGDVFLARPEGKALPSPVVIKRLHAQLASQADFVKRFQHEAELAVAIESRHVARVFDVGRVEDTFYIAMEYVAGWTVARVIKDLTEAGGSASIASAADVIRGGLSGLAALHGAKHPETGQSLGIIHRDIAPKNLMIGEDGVTRLIDLGLGKSNLSDWRTGTGVVMGSPGYMAPEQVLAEGVDQKSDLYAMGIVLWELLTLKRYIKRAPVPIMLRTQVKPTYSAPSLHRSDVPAALDAICAKALDIAPERRFQSAAEFLAALDDAVPPREEEEPLATIVGSMLWGELGQAKTEVTRLLSVVPSDPIAREAQRVEVVAAADPTPMVFPTPMPMTHAPPARGVPVRAVVVLMGLTLLIGLGIGGVVLRDRTPAIVAKPLEVVDPPPPAPIPAAVPQPIEATPPSEARPPKPLKRVVKAAERSEPAPRPKAIDPPPPVASDRERILAVMTRARALRARAAGSPTEREVTALLGKAAQEASASEVNASVLLELEAALRRLENSSESR
jgi:serine/threonine-protein kinase